MLVKFQIIHKLDQKTFIQTIEEAVNLVNIQIIKDYPSSSEEEELPAGRVQVFAPKMVILLSK